MFTKNPHPFLSTGIRVKIRTILSGLLVVALVLVTMPVRVAYGAELTGEKDTMSNLKASTAANHTIQFTTPSGVAEGSTVTVTFPSGFGLTSIIEDDVDLADDGVDHTTAATCAGTEKASASVSSQILTFTICAGDGGAIAAASVVVIEIGTNATASGTGVNQITNPTAGDNKVISIGGTMADSGELAVSIIADDVVAVTAGVDPTLTFAINDIAIGFGTLSSSAARYATGDTTGNASEVEAHTIAASTNARSGYSITITNSGAATTLTSGTPTVTAIGAANTASSAGTEQFGVRFTATGGSGTVSVPYAAAGFALDTAAFPDEIASATGTSASTTFSARYLANITATTEAGDYSVSLRYVVTATF